MGNTAKRPILDEILNYEHDDLVIRMENKYNLSHLESLRIFGLLKKFLWLCNESNFDKEMEHVDIIIDEPLTMIDEYWHNFILYTKDYESFCKKYFGYFLHHSPTSESDKEKFKAEHKNLSDSDSRNKIIEERRKVYTYVYKKLGEETFKDFYFELPKKYVNRL
ncbi:MULTISPECIES: hypothetical protein [unclassified Pseudoalteromonas]|uniref:glycine-rich domain-containing protein n=1 Tax=unclassified Pseudoalteromonas TaxID=194690 RepID=UPI0019D0FD83|nr:MULTISPECIES: hypothetical protein [unclassified Pseudoalteromonas]MBR8845241.1 hypothetical protein [Pseudoalteromonas sp. JC3]QUI71704.1 hypothetical protein GSF13_19045 [Pseudoalteromonas sp. M8]WJE07885.1 hypothetical protein QSH61_13445 [Pseudoalteromonas sp. JC3]